MRLRAAFLAIAAAGFLIPAAPAAARDGASAIVHLADLDLDRAAGRAALEARIGTAARHICGVYAGQNLSAWRLRRLCEADVIADARSQMGLAAHAS